MSERFWSKVDLTGDCWTWTAGIGSHGYGAFHPAKGETVLAHRYAYEVLVGPIPEGLVLDHTCHNEADCAGGRDCPHRRCVNPAHLEPVDTRTNGNRSPNARASRSHCPHGHEYTPENTRLRQGPHGPQRICRACERIRDAARTPRNRRKVSST